MRLLLAACLALPGLLVDPSGSMQQQSDPRGEGDTDLVAVLREALLQPDGDRLRLYTDGLPTSGELLDHGRILADIAALNRLRPCPAAIDVQTFADDPPKGFLERLAAQSGGSYRRLP